MGIPQPAIIATLFLAISLSACSRANLPPTFPQAVEPVRGIAFVSERNGGQRDIFLIQPDGTGLEPLIASPEVDSDPAFSPDATMLAFRSRLDGSSDIFIAGADGSGPWVNLVNDPKDSFDDEFNPQWHPDGDLLAIFTDRFLPPIGNCKAGLGIHHLGFIPLDEQTFRIEHFDDLAGEQETLGWSPDGSTLAFGSICTGSHVRIHAWDKDSGNVSFITSKAYGAANPSYSPDGRFLAFSSSRDGPTDIFLYDLASGEITNLTQSETNDRHPSWSPDSLQIAFTRNVDGNDDIYILDLESGTVLRLTDHPGRDLLPNWSPAP
jgi:TolB protein